MDVKLANDLLIELEKSRKSLEAAEILPRQIKHEETYKQLRDKLAELSLLIYGQAMGQIYSQYPDLDQYMAYINKNS